MILTPGHILCNFISRLLFICSPEAKIRMWHWGWGCYENTLENQNWHTGNRYIFCYGKSIVNLKLIFWNYNHMGFHLIYKKILLLVKPWGMRMGTSYFNQVVLTGSITSRYCDGSLWIVGGGVIPKGRYSESPCLSKFRKNTFQKWWPLGITKVWRNIQFGIISFGIRNYGIMTFL